MVRAMVYIGRHSCQLLPGAGQCIRFGCVGHTTFPLNNNLSAILCFFFCSYCYYYAVCLLCVAAAVLPMVVGVLVVVAVTANRSEPFKWERAADFVVERAEMGKGVCLADEFLNCDAGKFESGLVIYVIVCLYVICRMYYK